MVAIAVVVMVMVVVLELVFQITQGGARVGQDRVWRALLARPVVARREEADDPVSWLTFTLCVCVCVCRWVCSRCGSSCFAVG